MLFLPSLLSLTLNFSLYFSLYLSVTLAETLSSSPTPFSVSTVPLHPISLSISPGEPPVLCLLFPKTGQPDRLSRVLSLYLIYSASCVQPHQSKEESCFCRNVLSTSPLYWPYRCILAIWLLGESTINVAGQPLLRRNGPITKRSQVQSPREPMRVRHRAHFLSVGLRARGLTLSHAGIQLWLITRQCLKYKY